MFLLGCSCITAAANKEHNPNLGPTYSYLDVAALLLLQTKNIIQILGRHVPNWMQRHYCYPKQRTYYKSSIVMFLIGCSCITATVNKEHSPNLGPSCSQLDAAALLLPQTRKILQILDRNVPTWM